MAILLFLFILLVCNIGLIYVQIRNEKVAEFRMRIIEYGYNRLVKTPIAECKEYISKIDETNYDEEELIAMCDSVDKCNALYDYIMDGYEKVSYDKMLYSFKKLTVDNFFSQEWCEIFKTYVDKQK